MLLLLFLNSRNLHSPLWRKKKTMLFIKGDKNMTTITTIIMLLVGGTLVLTVDGLNDKMNNYFENKLG